jgi:hypothetical protein
MARKSPMKKSPAPSKIRGPKGKPKVYIETSFVSYLTAWPSRDLIVAGHQQITHEWWRKRRQAFDLVTSDLVFDEASGGDPDAAKARVEILGTMTLLRANEQAFELAQVFLRDGALPAKATVDALHVAVAVLNGIDYLLTWNCRHLAHGATRRQLDRICSLRELETVEICTPEELLEE